MTKYTCHIGADLRSYFDVEVEADSVNQAIAKLPGEVEGANIHVFDVTDPNGNKTETEEDILSDQDKRDNQLAQFVRDAAALYMDGDMIDDGDGEPLEWEEHGNDDNVSALYEMIARARQLVATRPDGFVGDAS